VLDHAPNKYDVLLYIMIGMGALSFIVSSYLIHIDKKKYHSVLYLNKRYDSEEEENLLNRNSLKSDN